METETIDLEKYHQCVRDLKEVLEEAKPFSERTQTPPLYVAELYAAIAKAQADCAGTEKRSENSHHRYKYASAEDMIDAATQAMAPHDLWLVCTSAIPDDPNHPKSMTVMYLLGHKAGGSMPLGPYSLTVHPDKGRPMDKAITTCLTYLQAYCIRGILNVPRVEEGTERDSTDDKAIQAWQSEEQASRKRTEDKARTEHAAKLKVLNAVKKRVFEKCEPFMKAAHCNRDGETMRAFLLFASGTESHPAPTDMDAQSALMEHVQEYIVAWGTCEPMEADSMAHDFDVLVNGKSDSDARAEAAFDAAQE